MIVDRVKEDHFKEVCSMMGEPLDLHLAYRSAKELMGSKDGSMSNWNCIKKIQDRWYESLPNNPDYDVYSEPMYIAEIWACWVKYTSKYIKALSKSGSLDGKRSIVEYIGERPIIDLGCGFGYSTCALSEVFNSDIYCTNIEGSFQSKIVLKLSKEYPIKLHYDFDDLPKNSLIFASEYFEHFERPFEHLDDVIKNLKPKHLLIANTFNGDAIGHFDTYLHKKKRVHSSVAQRLFGKAMRHYGYKRINTKLWNNRPSLWSRIK
tara:strand:- start:437 stop:1225 length:789 start_codon:yes stop_codon:yes gene_type:complete